MDRSKIISDALKTQQGRNALAATMMTPLRTSHDYAVDVCTRCQKPFWEKGEVDLHTEDDCLVQQIMDR